MTCFFIFIFTESFVILTAYANILSLSLSLSLSIYIYIYIYIALQKYIVAAFMLNFFKLLIYFSLH